MTASGHQKVDSRRISQRAMSLQTNTVLMVCAPRQIKEAGTRWLPSGGRSQASTGHNRQWHKVGAMIGGRHAYPSKDLSRAPSLFERVTQSFARVSAKSMLSQKPEPAMAGADAPERPASKEEELYDIPTFLRR